MAGTRAATTGAAAGAPQNAKVILGSLILVAAVANLNLSVANVALPSIGASFDSSQTALDLIAVGYSLGLAASVLWFGALGDRYGRKRMIVLGMLITIPASLAAGFAPNEGGAVPRARVRRARSGHGVPDDPRPHHCTLVGACPDALHRDVVRARRRRGDAWTADLRPAARVLRMGLGVPHHVATCGAGPVHGQQERAGARERGDGEGRQHRRRPVRDHDRLAGRCPQLHHGAQPADVRGRAVRRCRDRRRAVRPPPEARREPAL